MDYNELVNELTKPTEGETIFSGITPPKNLNEDSSRGLADDVADAILAVLSKSYRRWMESTRLDLTPEELEAAKEAANLILKTEGLEAIIRH